MKISTKGRYALRIMLELALQLDNGYVSLKDISKSQDVSDKYSEQIINQLSKAGFVASVRGAKGGYRLSYPPEHYTVGSILRLLEGSLAPVSCIDSSTPANKCNRASQCVTIEVWEKIRDAVDNVVDNITLQDLLNRAKEKCSK